ncbi:MAG TPA: condensation domain-containing protein [Jatrophihabitans sp.]|nr:condensation domain-containing protein [Jatrophihabitans sp.]
MSLPEVVAPAEQPDGAPDRFPLSNQQQLFCGDAGAFGPRFIVTKALRITGPLEVAALQAALDDVVVRHETLRTIVVRDSQPPYQRVYPPSRVPLEVRQLAAESGRSRDEQAEDILAEAELGSINVEELPMLRAVLARFDDRDSVLSLLTHHSACDGWSLHLVVRDLAACYAARTGERPLSLPPVTQYREYAEWQLRNAAGPEAERNLAFWREQLGDAGVFTLPTDRPVQPVHSQDYRSDNAMLSVEQAAAITQLAKSARCSGFMVMLAAFNVLAHRISGSTAPVINTIIHGRGQPQFKDTVGLFLNFMPLRTDLAGCTSFRDVLKSTRNTCLNAYAHELPIEHLDREIPTLMAPLADPANCDLIFGYFESPFADGLAEAFRISERTSTVIRKERISEQMPSGAAWSIGALASGEIRGGLQFNPEEFDDSTAHRWVSDYARIVTAALADPDGDWSALGDVAGHTAVTQSK